MDEKKIETMMNLFDDMFLQHVSWMSEEKKKRNTPKDISLAKNKTGKRRTYEKKRSSSTTY